MSAVRSGWPRPTARTEVSSAENVVPVALTVKKVRSDVMWAELTITRRYAATRPTRICPAQPDAWTIRVKSEIVEAEQRSGAPQEIGVYLVDVGMLTMARKVKRQARRLSAPSLAL